MAHQKKGLKLSVLSLFYFYDLIPSPDGDRWYKARVEMITVEDNGKEKRKAVSIYVQASNITDANKLLQKELTNLDCELISITRSPILEVYRATHAPAEGN